MTYANNSQGYETQGSGFFISVDGYILTNFHVIANEAMTQPADNIEIWTIEDEYSEATPKYVAEIIAYDIDLDLAIISPAYEIDAEGQILPDPIVDFKTSNYVDLADYNPSIGDELNILGFPAASLNTTVTLTTGIVSGFSMLSSFSQILKKIGFMKFKQMPQSIQATLEAPLLMLMKE